MRALAKRTQQLQNSGSWLIWEKAEEMVAAGADVIRLEIGEPDFETPENIQQAAFAAMQAGRTRYAMNSGDLSLRQAIAESVASTRGVDISAESVLASPGVKSIIYYTIQALVEVGEEVLIPSMGLPGYEQITLLSGAKPVHYGLKAENGFLPDSAEIDSLITDKTALIILNSPANPSGAIYDLDTLKAIADVAKKHDIWVISDEIYSQLYFTDEFPPSIFTIDGMRERTILLDGFSKTYAMTGWRVGYGVFPDSTLAALRVMMSSVHTCLPPFIQDAATEALTGPQEYVAELRQAFKARRDAVMVMLDEIPHIKAYNPDGAFYIMVDVSALDDGDGLNFGLKLLDEGVSVSPASAFGPGGHGFIRLALNNPVPVLEEAMRRLARVVMKYNDEI